MIAKYFRVENLMTITLIFGFLLPDSNLDSSNQKKYVGKIKRFFLTKSTKGKNNSGLKGNHLKEL